MCSHPVPQIKVRIGARHKSAVPVANERAYSHAKQVSRYPAHIPSCPLKSVRNNKDHSTVATAPGHSPRPRSLRDIVSYAVVCRVCPRHGMQIHIQTCTCADRYTYSYLDMSMSSAVCRWVFLERSIGCVPHPYRERHFSP